MKKKQNKHNVLKLITLIVFMLFQKIKMLCHRQSSSLCVEEFW